MLLSVLTACPFDDLPPAQGMWKDISCRKGSSEEILNVYHPVQDDAGAFHDDTLSQAPSESVKTFNFSY